MDKTIAQLKHVRRTSRAVLIARPVIGLVGVVGLALLIGGAVDYALRLPGWIRLGVGVCGVVAVTVWLARRLAGAWRYRPSLSALALRAEHIFPQLQGVLASGVEFATTDGGASGGSSEADAMKQICLRSVREQAGQCDLRKMVVYRRLGRVGLNMLLVGLIAVCVGATAPDVGRLALTRWLVPLGPAQWPRRTGVVSDVTENVWPADTPVRVRASIQRGYYPGIRVWVHYRVIDPTGHKQDWQSLLMSEQAESKVRQSDVQSVAFERLVDLETTRTGTAPGDPGLVEFYVEAGDDQTPLQTIDLVHRPDVVAIVVRIEPPAYARGLVDPVTIDLDTTSANDHTIEAIVGSAIQLSVRFNKPIGAPPRGFGSFLPGLVDDPGVRITTIRPDSSGRGIEGIHVYFDLGQTIQTPISLVDEHGVVGVSEPRIHIEAVADRNPSVAVTAPDADQSVLPTAQLDLAAIARDDVGLESLQIEVDATRSIDDLALTNLPRKIGREKNLSVHGPLDLRDLGLQPGDGLVVTATAQDVYDLNGQRHRPVRSAPRRIKVIDAATLTMNLQSRLAGMRRQIQRTRDKQQALLDRDPVEATSMQGRITEQIEAMTATVTAVQRRMRLNRLDAPSLASLVQRSDTLLTEGADRSRAAQQRLTQTDDTGSAARAAAHQEGVIQNLDQLQKLIGQGRGVLARQVQMRQLRELQRALAEQTRNLLPKTLGRTPDQLTAKDRGALTQIAKAQADLAERAADLAQQMQLTADGLNDQGANPRDLAAAQALLEAAAIGRRQGLGDRMTQASDNAESNRLAAAGSDQRAALETMQQMLDALGDVEKHRQDILRRRMLRLAEAIEDLLNQQRVQTDRLVKAKTDLRLLEAAQQTVRRNTLAVAETADSTPEAKPVSKHLQGAAASQGSSITHLRTQDGEAAKDDQAIASEHLEEAWRIAKRLARKAQADQIEKKRRELREAYQQLAAEQDKVSVGTGALVRDHPGRRRMRAALMDLAKQQEQIRSAAAKLGERVADTVVFTHLHERIDRVAVGVVQNLKGANVTDLVLADQETIAPILRQMARALVDPEHDDAFSDSSGGGGGGGGGGSSNQMVIPPVRELVLLRGIQESVMTQTRDIDRVRKGGPEIDHGGQALGALAEEQSDLAELARELGDRINKANGVDPPRGLK